METKKSLMTIQNLSPIGIIKEAISILAKKRTNFVIFTALTSLPLFCFSVYFETLFQNFLVTVFEILQQDPFETAQNWPIPVELASRLDRNLGYQLLYLCSLYLIPLPILELGTVLAIVGPASKIYSECEDKNSVDTKTRFGGVAVTFFYAFLLSTFTLMGLIWIVTTMYIAVPRLPWFDALIFLFFLAAFCLALKFYLEWKALWLMSVVISSVEGVYGVEAIVLSTHFNRGNEKRGIVLMFFFFLFGVSLRLPCLFSDCFKTELWIVAQTGLLCFMNVVKWIALVVYFHGCKIRYSEKKEVV